MATLVLPRIAHYPEVASTSGPEFADLYEYAAGHALFTWQQWCLAKGLGERPDGKWASFQNTLVVPRQNGKDEIFVALGLGWLFLTGERLIGHSAHEYKTAMEAFRRLVGVIENCDSLRRKVKKIINTNGEEGIELLTGQRMRFLARSKGAGRGFSFDKMIWNEAYALTAPQVDAVLPALSARPNPQIWLGSSPPLDEATGEALFRARRNRKAPGVTYIDYGADLTLGALGPCRDEACSHHVGVDGCILDNAEVRAAANPSAPHLISDEAMDRERATMDPNGYARERFGGWPPDLVDGFTVISKAQWEALKDMFSGRVARGDEDPGTERALQNGTLIGRPVFAVATSPRSQGPVRTSIALAQRRMDGKAHLEHVISGGGTAWVPDALATLKERWNPAAVIIDPGAPEGSITADVEAKGMAITPMATRDVAAAFGMIYDAATSENPEDRNVVHIGQAEPAKALQGAGTRNVGGEGRAWDQRVSGTDMTPIVGMTKALWGLAVHGVVAETPTPWVAYA